MSGPVADLDFAWIRGALPGFKQRLHAHQKSCPPRTAVVHEFHRLLPTFVFEQNDGVAIGLTELPVDMSGDPLLRSVTTSHSTRLSGFSSRTFMSNPPAPPNLNLRTPPASLPSP